jgi:hypothetical protein
VRNREAFDAVSDIGSSCFGGGKEAGVLVSIGLLCETIGAVGVCAICPVGAVGDVCIWEVNAGGVKRLVEILHLQTVKDGEDTPCGVEIIMY